MDTKTTAAPHEKRKFCFTCNIRWLLSTFVTMFKQFKRKLPFNRAFLRRSLLDFFLFLSFGLSLFWVEFFPFVLGHMIACTTGIGHMQWLLFSGSFLPLSCRYNLPLPLCIIFNLKWKLCVVWKYVQMRGKNAQSFFPGIFFLLSSPWAFISFLFDLVFVFLMTTFSRSMKLE